MFKFRNKDDKFYDMLFQSAKTVYNSAKILNENLDCLDKKEEQVEKTSKLEDIGDDLVRKLTKELDEAFITPIDREDIYQIVKGMDNILDCINSIMHRFIMFDIMEASDRVRKECRYLLNTTRNLYELMDELKKNGCKSKVLLDKIMAISAIESEADKSFREDVAFLFKNEKDSLTVIKWKEIYQKIENTIDSSEKVANIVEGVVIKNA
ncbi:DUF47 family protein [Clostridium sp. BJN0001]|uniref:DUF47 domain-containing protein n=1 Tax=Clostridium sp. BJN0001 TaxID=2930219 RepID=UPI001FD5ECB7|nr:DUF47 family protein [Clostridium sp. BJN0001]